ncbi:MAG: FAD-dependent oxidoreductase [Lachnospiraceae bacterium]|nr:FAD-dependent oxidoreductase [Lachnospiraceae bacterium]
MYDVIIIGSGPAGLSASVYAKRAGLKALTLEKNPVSGGQVLNTYEVDNYLGLPGINGFDMGMKFREHADGLGCEFQTAEVLSVCKEHREEKQLKAASVNETAVDAAFEPVRAQGFMIETDEGVFRAKAVVAAMGAVHAKLGIPGEEEMAGRGVSYCATCDGAFFRGKVTAVIGGGDVAVEDAIFLARGCEKVYLIHRRDELRAAKILQEEVMSLPNVEIIWDTVAEKIEGNGQVEGISLKNVKTGDKMELPVDGVFVAVGILPDSEILKEIVNCDPKGYVLAGEDGVTDVPGIFAAGDIRSKKLRQIVTAVADGASAIQSVQEYLLQAKITK